ncbi:low temperature requirement protein A [Nonomuraea endophytica]|uniref:Low temperature requirement protein LtrA n=1 Tax=Nonomuraea endophytica TaxID=714136 RepID=A0A7W8ABJ5_9ACTN|nr:low temperature requirement protein A [Nonomuraea endophytica]MBB5083267.1 low temperature requirement protein LtrA [Nonomuraea endophytica]
MRAIRNHGAEGPRVAPFELFFDLVFVFAITQLSHLLLAHPTFGSAAQALFLTLAVWWAWMYTTWTTNYCDPNHPVIRIMLAGLMLASLIMAASVPEAFGDRAMWFALAYVAIQCGRTAVVIWATAGHRLQKVFIGVCFWFLISAVFWITGAWLGGAAQVALWIIALLLDYGAPMIRFPTPVIGRSSTHDWQINGAHMAERCQLFIIIALGESILVTGATLARATPDALTLAAFTICLLGSVAMWWVYFDTAADLAAERIESSDDPGRLGRSAYTYAHIPMVLGIIVSAVGDELVIAHPGGHAEVVTVLTALGGPALYLAGHTWFKYIVFGTFSLPRLTAIGALCVLAVLAILVPVVPPLLLSTGSLVILIVVAIWDTHHYRRLQAAA